MDSNALSASDTDAKMQAFAALGSKTAMRAHIDMLNKGISGRKDKIRVTGSIEKLKENYKKFLESSVAGQASGETVAERSPSFTKPPDSQRNSKTVAAPIYDDSDDDGVATGYDTSMLSMLTTGKNLVLSTLTIECLNLLNSPHAKNAEPKDEENDISTNLEPLWRIVFELVAIRNSVSTELSHNHAANFAILHQRIQSDLGALSVPAIFATFAAAIGLRNTPVEHALESEREEDHDIAMAELASGMLHSSGAETGEHGEDESAMLEEINIVWDAVTFALKEWSKTFPAPPAEHTSWPADFNADEKKAIRAFGKKYIEANPSLASPSVDRRDTMKGVDEMKKNWPIEKGRSTSIARAVLGNMIGNYRLGIERSVSRSRSRSRSLLKEDEMAEVEEEGRKQGLERKRPIIESDDEEDDDEVQVGVRSNSRGSTRGRARLSRPASVRYPSPTKIGARTSLASVEEDEDE